MSRFMREHVKSAKFYRNRAYDSIDIILSEDSKSIFLYPGGIDRCAKTLSETELEEVISILANDKEAMLKQRNFPAIYGEMLSDLIEVQRERYGVKKGERRKLPYCMDPSTLETMFEQNYDITDVHIDTIDINFNLKCGWRDLTLIMKFREAKEDE